MRALIGYTGFVGSNLRAFGRYDALYNSRNSSDMCGQHFAEIVCAGVSAVKWKANSDPETDWANVSALIKNLVKVRAGRFVLLSTVDVYQKPIGVTEADAADEIGTAYGVHRARLEGFIAETFSDYVIIRLPALYGRGLKKNAIYDLRYDNMVDAIDPRGSFQWYDVRRLERDMRIIVESGLKLVNITSEPVAMSVIGDRFFPGKLQEPNLAKVAVCYDIRTQHATLLGGKDIYHFDRAQVLDSIGDYLEEGR